jgi:hypothetical protein
MKTLIILFSILFLIHCKDSDPEPNCQWEWNGLKLIDAKYGRDPACPEGKSATFQNVSPEKLRYQICFELVAGGWDTHSGVLDPREIVEVSVCENSSGFANAAIYAAGNSACKLPSCGK